MADVTRNSISNIRTQEKTRRQGRQRLRSDLNLLNSISHSILPLCLTLRAEEAVHLIAAGKKSSCLCQNEGVCSG